jgi:hypothetical protein
MARKKLKNSHTSAMEEVAVEENEKERGNVETRGRGKRNPSNNSKYEKGQKKMKSDPSTQPLCSSSSSSSSSPPQPFSTLLHLPRDLLRCVLPFLNFKDLMKVDEAFLANHELISYWNSSLEGVAIFDRVQTNMEKEYGWVTSHKMLITNLVLGSIVNKVRTLKRFWTPTLTQISIIDGGCGKLGKIPCCPALTVATFDNCQG